MRHQQLIRCILLARRTSLAWTHVLFCVAEAAGCGGTYAGNGVELTLDPFDNSHN
jgi:hypothetical protein